VGRYLVYGEIAAGGMATVHFGRLTGVAGFARSVAIKRLHAQFARDPEFVSMFLDEARLAARITHPNVVATLDVVSTDDDLFLVMDYVRGVSLSQLVRILKQRGERMPPLVATGIVAGVLHGLHAAHEAKSESGERLDIVHRDVSPQNVLVGTDGVARVLDFGVAKAAGRLQTTRDGKLKGKLPYMAPEQIHGTAVTRRTDVYAASVVLWEVLTGERLFKGDNEGNILSKVLSGPVPPPSSIVSALPASLDRVVLRGLQREAGDRYATAREMAQDVDASLGVASAAEIGDWVERVAAEELDQRAKRIAEIELDAAREESDTTVLPSAPRLAPDAPTPVGRRAPEETTSKIALTEAASQVSSLSVANPTPTPPAPRERSVPLWMAAAGGAAAVVAIGAVILLVLSRREPPVAAAAAASASAPPAASAQATAPSASHASSAAAPSWGPDVDAAPIPAVAVSSLPTVPWPTRAPPAPAPAPARPRSVDCNPPYTTDAKGHVHFKRECM
jgi:serine/threonine-protein kinase